MKNAVFSKFFILMLLNAGLASAIVFVTSRMKEVWTHVLAGEPMPSLTVFILNYGVIWPLGLVAAGLVLWLAAITGKFSEKRLEALFLAIVFYELVMIPIHLLGLVAPAIHVHYALG